MGICHLKNAELEAKHGKYKGRVALRGDIVKDDSGPSAVFTEQGSSASQMTAVKVMDARLRGTSSWRSTCLYPSTNGGCSQIILKFPNRNVKTFGFVYHDTNGLNHGPVWKTQSFLLIGICMVVLCRTVMRKAIWENPIAARLGEGFQIGNACSYTVKNCYSYLCMWMT